MFGPPSQHLLPSHPPASTEDSSVDSHAGPMQPAPVSFRDFRFNSIGKQPELLSRISLPQPDHTEYHSPTPSPTSTPSPVFTREATFQPKTFSRPTLLQQLAGHDFNRTKSGDLGSRVSTSQSNRSLASRLQMNSSPSNDVAAAAPYTASRVPSPPPRLETVSRTTRNASLIPPVEVLPQLPESSSPSPASLAHTLGPLDAHSPASSAPMNITTNAVSATIVPGEPAEPFPYLAAVDAMMQDLQSSPVTTATTDSLMAQRERLQAISANLVGLASPLPPSLSQSSSPTPSVSQTSDNINQHSIQPQHTPVPVPLHRPYSANQSSNRVGLGINDIWPSMIDSSPTLVHSPTTITQEHQIQRKAVVDAFRNLNSVFKAVHRAQIDSENALANQVQALEEQRVAFEQTKLTAEATLRKRFQELQRKHEELDAKETSLTSLEEECKAREVARKVMLAKRQAQEDEKRAVEARRTHEVQEQIAAALATVKEVEALKAKSKLGQLANETAPDDLPTEFHESMDEEEKAVIKTRNDLLRALKHLRRMHSDKVQKLEESNHALRRLEERRKQRETERLQIAEEERLRAHAEAELARQIDGKQWQEVENDHEQTRPLAEQQAHAEVQPHGLRRTEGSSGQTRGHYDHPEEVSTSLQLDVADTGIRAAPDAHSLASEVTATVSVNEDADAFVSHPPVPSSGIRTNSESLHGAILRSKQEKHGTPLHGVMFAGSTSKSSAGHLSPPPLAEPSLSASDRTANILKPARTPPPISVPAEDRHRSVFPAQLASEFNRVANSDIRPNPDHKPAFPRTPKSQTLLEATSGRSEELIIGPVTRVSPAQQNVNLRHLKRYRNRIEENDSGDRSVRTHVKNEETNLVSLQGEEHDEQSRERMQTPLPANLSALLPPRPTVISPPRPRKRLTSVVSQINSTYFNLPESSRLLGDTQAAIHEQPRDAPLRGNPWPQTMNTSVQQSVPHDPPRSLLLGPVHAEPQPIESRLDAGERSMQDRAENHVTTFSEFVGAAPSHELDGEDRPRNKRKSTDEHRRARNGNNARRQSGHRSPSFVTSRSAVTSPTQAQRLVDSRRPRNPNITPRVESMRATSPTTGRKRPLEITDHDRDHGHRARRQRDDVWIAPDHGRDRVDSYHLHRDRQLDSESDNQHTGYRTPPSPLDRVQPHSSDMQRMIYDNRAHLPLFPEESTAPPARWEQAYKRSDNVNGNSHQRYHPSASSHNVMTDQHCTDNVRVDQNYGPTTEVDVQPDPSLLVRISDTQHFPPSNNSRGRNRGEPNRARGDSGRGRGRGAARGGTTLIERLTSGPMSSPSLGDRLT